jgi:hypothetical protein
VIDTAAKKVDVKIQQIQATPAFFTMPIEIKVSFPQDADTTIRVMNTVNSQQFSFTFNKTPISVVFDPDNEIVLKQASTVQAVGISADNLSSLHYTLEQNYPNPFNPATHIQFTLSKTSPTSLKIYDLLGKEVATLLHATMNPGQYTVQWDGSNVPGGVYFYQLRAGQFVQTKKLILLK